MSEGAFTPDANGANKSRYSCVVGRVNILSLLAHERNSLHIRIMGGASARQLQSLSKCIPVFVKVRSSIIQLRVPTYNHD